MNKFERLIYDMVKRSPKLKLMLRDVYQRLFSFVPVRSCLASYPITVRQGYFFGFHDHTPFSINNDKLLGCRYLIPLRMPRENDELEVGFFYGDEFRIWQSVGRTCAWNWHQGCKLQWRGSLPELIYNDFVKGKFISRIHNVQTGEIREIPNAIASVSTDGRWAVGYSFERVERYMPGYGYIQQANEKQLDSKMPDKSGLYLIDLQSGITRELFSIADIVGYKTEPNFQATWHYFSHTVFCPSNERIVFLHRWTPKNTHARQSRMFTCDLYGTSLYLFPTREMVSHLGWRNEKEIVAYCRLRNGQDMYVLFVDQNAERFEALGAEVFSSDGHPSFSPDGRWMITDTYPDRTRRSYLVLYDTYNGRRFNLAYLHSPFRFASRRADCNWSCDLHPRFDRFGRYLCFDATYTGQRSLCTIDLGEDFLAQLPKSIAERST